MVTEIRCDFKHYAIKNSRDRFNDNDMSTLICRRASRKHNRIQGPILADKHQVFLTSLSAFLPISTLVAPVSMMAMASKLHRCDLYKNYEEENTVHAPIFCQYKVNLEVAEVWNCVRQTRAKYFNINATNFSFQRVHYCRQVSKYTSHTIFLFLTIEYIQKLLKVLSPALSKQVYKILYQGAKNVKEEVTV